MTRSAIRTTSRLLPAHWAPTSKSPGIGRARITAALTVILLLTTAPGIIHAQSDEQRLDRLERLLESSTLLEMAELNEQLRIEVQRLTGELDRVQRELSELQRQQRSIYEDADSRLQALEQQAGSPPADNADPLVPETPTLDDEVDDRTTGQNVDPADNGGIDRQALIADYDAAFDLLREGRYEEASTAFKKVVDEYPDTPEADNARYWLGESYYVVRDFDSAMEHFLVVMKDPNHSKLPDAMLKSGYIYYEQGEYDNAREMLEKVHAEFPDTTAATLAENRLGRMTDEGH